MAGNLISKVIEIMKSTYDIRKGGLFHYKHAYLYDD